MGIFKNRKNKKILNEINKLNNNKLQILGCVEGIYRASLNINYDKIKLPKNIKSTIHLYSDDGTLQVFFLNENGEKFAVIDCLKTEKMLEEQKEKEEIRKKIVKLEEEKRNLVQKADEIKRKKINEINEGLAQRRYKNYIEFLIENGANKEIIELEPVKNLIMSIIKNGDPRVIMNGKSPIVYNVPNPDGTFQIVDRLNGPIISYIYNINYCNDDNPSHFIKITKEKKQTLHYAMDDSIGDDYDVTILSTTYVDKDGNIIKDEIKRI